jgi:hypothetical protein
VEEIIERKKLDVKSELNFINSETIFEYEKTLENFDIDKVKAYTVEDNNRTVCLLFYYNDFFAINRINFKDGFEYDEKKVFGISENLNYRIKKIPNVAKTRKILNIEDIETRIYDVSEYIVLLQKENIKVLRVNSPSDLKEMDLAEYPLDLIELSKTLNELEIEEEERIREERNIKNKFAKLAKRAKLLFMELKNKLIKTNQVNMLSDGKHSIFDKEEN